MLTPMTTQLESLRKHSVVVADTGDIDAVARWKPQDATTNPSLLLASAADPRYRPLLERAMAQAGGDAGLSMDWLFVQFGREILKHVAGRVSTEVDARLSFDTEKSIEKARRLVALYEKVGVGRERVLGADHLRHQAAEKIDVGERVGLGTAEEVIVAVAAVHREVLGHDRLGADQVCAGTGIDDDVGRRVAQIVRAGRDRRAPTPARRAGL